MRDHSMAASSGPVDDLAFVLVGEDNPANQMALDALLERCGVKADFVSDGAAVVEAVRTGRYRLILLDLMMPKMTGFEATREIRRMEYGTGRHTPIMAVTAVDLDLSREVCIEAGIDDFIAKPIELEVLQERLARWLPLRGAAEVALERRRQPENAVQTATRRLRPTYDADGAAAVLESFLGVTGKLLERLDDAIAAQEHAIAEHLAGELKGSRLALSAGETARLSRQLERDVRANDWPAVLRTYRDLIAAYKRMTEELRKPLRAVPPRKPDLPES
jgi:CheY-like chemotaxis protein